MGLPREFPHMFVSGLPDCFSPQSSCKRYPGRCPKPRTLLPHFCLSAPGPCSRALAVQLEVQGLLWEVPNPVAGVPAEPHSILPQLKSLMALSPSVAPQARALRKEW